MSTRAPLSITWIRSRSLAIGPIPINNHQWESLSNHGIRSVLSCCAANEADWSPPTLWEQRRISLSDHRDPDALQPDHLAQAIDMAIELWTMAPPLYLHCYAGQERSPLVAIGALCRKENLDLFEALAQVKRLHPRTKPLTQHLVLLDELLKQ